MTLNTFNLLEVTEDLNPTKKEPCGGLFYRVRKSLYMDSNGVLHDNTRFIPLKRKSCKVDECDTCSYMMDDLRERDYDVIYDITLKDGDLVELKVTNISRDWESGYIDDWDLEFIKHQTV